MSDRLEKELIKKYQDYGLASAISGKNPGSQTTCIRILLERMLKDSYQGSDYEKLLIDPVCERYIEILGSAYFFQFDNNNTEELDRPWVTLFALASIELLYNSLRFRFYVESDFPKSGDLLIGEIRSGLHISNDGISNAVFQAFVAEASKEEEDNAKYAGKDHLTRKIAKDITSGYRTNSRSVRQLQSLDLSSDAQRIIGKEMSQSLVRTIDQNKLTSWLNTADLSQVLPEHEFKL